MLCDVFTRKRVKNFIELCIDWCLIDRFETHLFRVRVQMYNMVCLKFLERAIFGNYHAHFSLYIIGKTTIRCIVKCWWLWMWKILFGQLDQWSMNINGICHLSSQNIATRSLLMRTHHILHAQTGYMHMTLHSHVLSHQKKILYIHNHQHFTMHQIVVFPTMYSEKYAW